MNVIQRARVLSLRYLTKSTFVLQLERNNFVFIPGQCVNIGLVGDGINREYSTYSGANDNRLEFLIKKVDKGMVSVGLSRLKPGDEVTIDGAYGKFVIENPSRKRKCICIGSGTGIAPFHSFVTSYRHIDYFVIHGVRYMSDRYDRQDYGNNRYVTCVSREKGGDFSGRVTAYLKTIPLPRSAQYYLCGNREMINDVYDILRERRINGSNIFTEVFF